MENREWKKMPSFRESDLRAFASIRGSVSAVVSFRFFRAVSWPEFLKNPVLGIPAKMMERIEKVDSRLRPAGITVQQSEKATRYTAHYPWSKKVASLLNPLVSRLPDRFKRITTSCRFDNGHQECRHFVNDNADIRGNVLRL